MCTKASWDLKSCSLSKKLEIKEENFDFVQMKLASEASSASFFLSTKLLLFFDFRFIVFTQ